MAVWATAGHPGRARARRLSLRERWRLYRIGRALARSDPWLASWLATFSRLGAGDVMPAQERLP